MLTFHTHQEMSFSDKVGGEKEAREVLSQQRKIMKAQDETLDSISETMERLKHIGYVVLLLTRRVLFFLTRRVRRSPNSLL